MYLCLNCLHISETAGKPQTFELSPVPNIQIDQCSASLPSLTSVVNLKCPTLRFVPRSLRSEWSRAFSETLQDCLHLNDVYSYTYLFMLAKVCLRVPPTNLRSRKSKDDFTLSLLKKWRHSLNTSS